MEWRGSSSRINTSSNSNISNSSSSTTTTTIGDNNPGVVAQAMDVGAPDRRAHQTGGRPGGGADAGRGVAPPGRN
jgi:hypothetical protein